MPNNPIAVDSDPIALAIRICTTQRFKNSIIKVSSEWRREPKSFKREWDNRVENCIVYYMREEFDEEDEEITKQVGGMVYAIALRMLTWTEYHMKTFDFDQDFCLQLLSMDIFTSEGIIDNNKTRDLVYSEELNVEQRFRLACWHCEKEAIASLFRQLNGETKKYYVENEEDYIPEIVKFWAAFFNERESERSTGEKSLLLEESMRPGYSGGRKIVKNPEVLSQSSKSFRKKEKYVCDKDIDLELQKVLPLMFENVISSGSETALKYCIDEINSVKKKNLLVDFLTTKDLDLDVLIPLVIKRMEFTSDLMGESNTKNLEPRKYVDDWVAFRNPKCTKKEVWLPNHFVVDIFYSIFSMMSAEKKKKIAPKLQEAIESNVKVRTSFYKQLFSYFFCWPYHDKFKEFLGLCWSYIPFCYYGTFLFDLLERIKPTDSLYVGEDLTYDFIEFFLEFVSDSPEEFKSYVFKGCPKIVLFRLQDKTVVFNVGNTLLQRIITNSIYGLDRLIVRKILDLATLEEKKNFLNSDECRASYEYLQPENTKYFIKQLIGLCTSSKEERNYYIRKLGIAEKCLDLIKNLNFIQARKEFSLLNLRPLEQFKIKKEILFSEEGIKLLRRFGFEDRRNFDAFVEFFATRPDNFLLCQRLLDYEEQLDCLHQFIKNPEGVDRFLKSCISLSGKSKPEVILERTKQVKQNILFHHGTDFCDLMMFGSQYNDLKFEQKLTHLDNILNWIFLDFEKEEKNWKCKNFKRNLMLLTIPDFHYKFILSSRFDDAALFFTWVGLGAKAIEVEKKNKLFVCYKTHSLFAKALREKRQEPNERFIRDLLKWCLVDSETLKKFVEHYFNLIDCFLISIITDMNIEFMHRN